tara:strand:+ start:979 stop:1536 length:558 start_codon:yes stop_codon:yes gene_type:complete
MLDKNISNIIRSRQSVYPKDFNGGKISKNIVLEILKNANTAPSHKLTQPWFYKVFSGKSKMRLAEEIKNQTNINSRELYDSFIQKFTNTSHLICVCMRRDIKESIPEWEEIAATSMAVQNIWLSCVNSSIGGYWSTPGYIRKLKNYLNLSGNERCLGLFYLGIYNITQKRKLHRKDIESDIEWFE